MKGGSLEAGEVSKVASPPGVNRGLSILDLILRIIAVVGTLGSAVAMGTTDETLPFFTQFLRFNAQYDDFPSFSLFVIVNSIVCAYVALSIPLSVYHIVRTKAKATRIFLIIFDTVMLGLLSAAASAAAAIVYLAHKGNASANWLSVCQQFTNFCERVSGSLIGSYAAVVVFVLLIFLSAVALSRKALK